MALVTGQSSSAPLPSLSRFYGLRLLGLLVAVGCLLIGNALNDSLNSYWQDIVRDCGIAILMAVSLNIVNGLTGQFSIGHAGFMAVGAYAGASITYFAAQKTLNSGEYLGIAWMLPAMLAGGAVAAVFGVIVGTPSLRLRGDYLAIVTLGFGEIIRVLLENSADISPYLEYMGGATGFQNVPSLTNFLILFGTVALVIALSRNLKFSTEGLAFMSVREDEIAADAMGVNTTRVKITAFVLSAFFAGVAGALFAHMRIFQPKVFGFQLSINFVVMIVLGGTGSITGATLAAIALTLLPAALKPVRDRIHFTDEYLRVIYALILILMMILRPTGVFGMGELTLAGLRRRFGRGTLLPSAPATGPPGEGEADRSVAPTGEPETGRTRAEAEGETILNISGLTKQFGGLTAVGDVNLELKRGELAGLIGPNGAGKTTVFNLLTGVYEPSAGRLEFDGRLLAGERPMPTGPRLLRLAGDTLLAGGVGWIIGTILASSIVPYAATPAQQGLQSAVRWGVTLLCVGGALVTAPRRRRNLPGLRPFQFARRGIARTFQNIRLFGDLTVLENVRVATYLRRKTHLWDSLFQTRRLKREEAESIARARELLARFNLLRVENEFAKNLPYGDQRRLEIARALATGPQLLLLDEPAAGMNPQEKTQLMHLIRRIRDDFDLTILLIEHDMRLVMGICERITVLDYGRVIAEGAPEEIQRNPKVIAAYLGEDLGDADGDGVADGAQKDRPAAGKTQAG